MSKFSLGTEIPIKPKDRYRFLDKKDAFVLKIAEKRILLIFCLIFGAYFVLGALLFYRTIICSKVRTEHEVKWQIDYPVERPNLLDRNGVVLSTSLYTDLLYVDARDIKNPEKMAQDILTVFPNLNREKLLKDLKSRQAYRPIKNYLIPTEKNAVNYLGYPQLNFEASEKRFYPHGELMVHVLGAINTDNKGVSGLEMAFNDRLMKNKEDIVLSLDIRLQSVLRNEIKKAIDHFSALGGTGIILDVNTAEVLAMVSLPDFDPNLKFELDKSFNKASTGVYEVGSVMKLFNTAIGLDMGIITPYDIVDASENIKLGRFTVTDYKGEYRPLLIPEVLIYSSNIGSVLVAQSIGPEIQRQYFNSFGLLDYLLIDLPEKSKPIIPVPWDKTQGASVGYGYSISLSPLHVASGVAALVNGGYYQYPSFIKGGNQNQIKNRVIKKETSDKIRHMMRAVVNLKVKFADIEGYLVGGKTGTANMIVDGKYMKGHSRTTFVGVFPMDKPQYLVLVMLEDPKGLKEDWYYNAAGWNSARVGGNVIRQIAPILKVNPRAEMEKPDYIQKAYDIYEARKKK